MTHLTLFVYDVGLLLLLLVRLHDQSRSSDEVGGLLQVLQAPIYFLVKLVATVRCGSAGVVFNQNTLLHYMNQHK